VKCFRENLSGQHGSGGWAPGFQVGKGQERRDWGGRDGVLGFVQFLFGLSAVPVPVSALEQNGAL